MSTDREPRSDAETSLPAATVADRARRSGRPAWVAPAAASVAVVLVGLIAWALTRPSPSTPVSATTPVSTTAGPLTTGPSSAATPTASPTTAAAPGTAYAAPVYFVGRGTSTNPWVLYREVVPLVLGADTPQARAQAAVEVALGSLAVTDAPTYLRAWVPGTTATVTVADRIDIVLSAPGRTDVEAPAQHMALEQLVWTATAAAQRNVEVALTTSSGAPIFPDVPNGTYSRPTETTRDLAPVWVDVPGRFQAVPGDQPVTVRGQACTFEANVQWELRSAGATVRRGFTTATSACPTRGQFSVAVGRLSPGRYEIRVWEASAENGDVFAEQVMPFTVG